MYSFEGLAGGGSGGEAGAGANRARNFFAPSVFLKGPTAVPSANVNISAITIAPMYLVRLECDLSKDFFRDGIFFFAIASSFVRKPQSVVKQSWEARRCCADLLQTEQDQYLAATTREWLEGFADYGARPMDPYPAEIYGLRLHSETFHVARHQKVSDLNRTFSGVHLDPDSSSGSDQNFVFASLT